VPLLSICTDSVLVEAAGEIQRAELATRILTTEVTEVIEEWPRRGTRRRKTKPFEQERATESAADQETYSVPSRMKDDRGKVLMGLRFNSVAKRSNSR
jgi:hypothetical protein